MELLKKATVEEETIESAVQLDEEDVNALIFDCHDLLSRILDRSNPKWLQAEGLNLVKRLEEGLNWYKIH